MTIAQLDTQIRRKRREIEKLRDEEAVLTAKKLHLAEEYKERTENYERIRERLEQASREIESSDAELDRLRERVGITEADATSAASVNILPGIGGSDQAIAPTDCVKELIKQLELVQGMLAKDSGSEGIDGKDSSSQRGKSIKHVTIQYEHLGEFASFQVTPTYTFESLCQDACRYWGMEKESGTLRDDLNVMWPPQSRVSEHLASATTEDGTLPVVRLVARAVLGYSQPFAGGSGSKMSNDAVRKANNRDGDQTGDAMGNFDDESDSEMQDTEDATLIKEWRRMLNEKLSPTFHHPRYVGISSNFRALSANAKSSKEISHKLSSCLKLTCHVFLLVVMGLLLFSRRAVVPSYDTRTSLESALLDTQFMGYNFTAAPKLKTFRTMLTVDDFWGWANGPLLDVLFPQLDSSGRVLSARDRTFTLGSNRAMGGVRIRQYRVGTGETSGGCKLSTIAMKDGKKMGDVASVKRLGCKPDYSMDRQRMYVASLGDSTTRFTSREGDGGFTYRQGESSNSFPVITPNGYYDMSSFSIELPNDRGMAQQMIWRLQEKVWIDRQTSALIIDFNMLNINYYTMTSCSMVINFSPAGPIVTRTKITPVLLSLFQFGSGQDFLWLMFGDIVVFLFILYFTFWEIMTGVILYGCFTFMACIWHIVLVMLIVLQVVFMVLTLVYETTYVAEVSPATPHYIQYDGLLTLYSQITNLNTICFLLAIISTFRLIENNASFSKIWQTLHVSMGTLGGYFFISSIVLTAFIFTGYFTFGIEMGEFSSLIGSFNELLRMLSGNFHYRDLIRADSVVGPIFFGAYIFAILFLLTSAFVAILNDAYSQANSYLDDSGSTYWADVLLSPIRVCIRVVRGDSYIARKAIKQSKYKTS